MQVFVAGTGTNIGKTLVCSWLCLHTGFDYFKPIQTGVLNEKDSAVVIEMSGARTHQEMYAYDAPISPHLAAKLSEEEIDLDRIKLPNADHLIIEGAGGVLVPINKSYLMIDLIKKLEVPVILVASSKLGTINHTLMSLEAIRARNIEVLGVIVSGESNQDNCDAIEFYGKTKILAQLPFMPEFTRAALAQVPLPEPLKALLI